MAKESDPPGKPGDSATAAEQYVVKDPERFALNVARTIEQAGKAASAWADCSPIGRIT